MDQVTMKSNLIIPQVISDLVDSHLGEGLSLLPLTQTDDSLTGKPGDTLQFPAFRSIGKAEAVAENGLVSAGVLSADTVSVTVKKYAKAVRITDEARLSGLGDPLHEASRQLARSIDLAVDEALFDTLKTAPLNRRVPVNALSSEAIALALTLFGEDQEGDKVLLTDAQGFALLRMDPDYLRGSDLGQQMVFSGAVGQIWGCQIVLSGKVKPDAALGEKQHYILKPGALRLVNKTGTLVEVEREPEYMRDTIYCSKHCAAYLYDAGRLIVLTQFTGLQVLQDSMGIAAEPGGAGAVRVSIPAAMQAPQGYKWVYLLADTPEPAGVFGTALTGSRDWAGDQADILTGGKGYVHLYLAGAADLKPVKALSLVAISG
ncbi:MAG: N4-gp56 family major capsid protein [Clostridiales bacterium]|nr:N4-gp56 family major capsid protein [Clostridiales bacterium]